MHPSLASLKRAQSPARGDPGCRFHRGYRAGGDDYRSTCLCISRHMAAWIGLVPQQNSTGGKDRLGGITKQGNRYLRGRLVAGAMAVIRHVQKHGTAKRPWLARLIERKPTKVAAVALANKIARIAWVIMTRGERYRAPTLLTA